MEDQKAQIKFYIPKKDSSTVAEFLNVYAFENILFSSVTKQFPYLQKSERTCIFCGRKYGDTSFKNRAHLIPEFLGNKELYSDKECDECNNYFGINYEKHLAEYLGIYRTLSKIPNKSKFPTFKSPGELVTARVNKIDGNHSVEITRQNPDDSSIDFDVEKGILSINYRKNPYIPNRAYKALLKIALSFIPTDEVNADYALALRYLSSTNTNVLNGCFLTGIHLPFNVTVPPYLLLYKKKDPNARIPTHIMALHFYNTVLCIPVPLNKNDLFFYGQDINMFNCPLISLYPIDFENNKPSHFSSDMSSQESITGERDIISAQFDPSDVKALKAFNLNTLTIDNEAQFDPSSIMSIMIMDKEIPIDLSKLKRPLQ